VLRNAEGPLLHLDYGAATKLSRINKGLRRRKSKSIFGFFIDPQSGRWIKDPANGDDDDGMGDPTSAKPQRIVPIVEDHKNAMLVRPMINFNDIQMATFQHALIRGVQIEFELEEGELLGEPLPTRDLRNAVLLYEATEGGAGVLNRLVSDPASMAAVARRALKLMHYLEPYTPEGLSEAEDACVAGCYRCILSYYNQPDHEHIDRKDSAVIEFLCSLAGEQVIADDVAEASDPWLAAFQRWGLPSPTSLTLGGISHPFYWPSRDVLAVTAPPSPELASEAAARGVLDIVVLPSEPGVSAPADLVSALGVS
jgi:hypothetical protein